MRTLKKNININRIVVWGNGDVFFKYCRIL